MGTYLAPIQYGVAQAGVAAATLAAVAAATGASGAPAGSLAAVGANALLAAAADPIATAIRHGPSSRYLAWRVFAGRGGHIPVVAAGLGLTFGGAADPLIGVIEALAGDSFGPSAGLFARLFLGIEPMAAVVAIAAPKGQRFKTFLRETWANITGSGVATAVLPLWDGMIRVFGTPSGIFEGLAAQVHYVVGYLTVLAAGGWHDLPAQAREEVAGGRAANPS